MSSDDHLAYDPAEYRSRAAAAADWLHRAIEAQQEGEWALSDLEWQILADVMASTNPMHGSRLPPHVHDHVRVRVARISNWAGILRLAARAGGWELLSVAGKDPASWSSPVDMRVLLSAIYALAEQGERWQEMITATVTVLNAVARDNQGSRKQTLEQAISERNPKFERHLANAETFFTGPGSLEDLRLFFY